VDYCHPQTGEYNIYKEDMPVCQRTCPANLDIRSYVGLIADGKYLDSLAVIRDRLPLPGSIGRICPHPCETACNRQYLDEPISICFLKRFVADVELDENIEPVYETPDKKYPEKVAIIGAGPAGLTCAYDLARLGYEHITIFETLPIPGGYLWVGIPEYRLPKKLLKREVDLIASMGVEIRYNTRVGKDIAFDDLRREYDAIFIGAGCHKGLKLRVPAVKDIFVQLYLINSLRVLSLSMKNGVGLLDALAATTTNREALRAALSGWISARGRGILRATDGNSRNCELM